jgi:hypothetical protein
MALSVALIVKAHVGQLGHPPPSSPGTVGAEDTPPAQLEAARRNGPSWPPPGHRSTRSVRNYIEEGQLFDALRPLPWAVENQVGWRAL